MEHYSLYTCLVCLKAGILLLDGAHNGDKYNNTEVYLARLIFARLVFEIPFHIVHISFVFEVSSLIKKLS